MPRIGGRGLSNQAIRSGAVESTYHFLPSKEEIERQPARGHRCDNRRRQGRTEPKMTIRRTLPLRTALLVLLLIAGQANCPGLPNEESIVTVSEKDLRAAPPRKWSPTIRPWRGRSV